MKRFMPKRIQRPANLAAIVFAVAAAVLMITIIDSDHARAQASCSPSSNFGVVTKTVNVPSSSTPYHVWSRLKHSDGNPTYTFHMEGAGGSSCDQEVSATGGSDAWLWAEAPATVSWSGGSATISLSGNKSAVGLDCIVLTVDSSFSPSSASDCTSSGGDTTLPNIIITTNDNAIASTDSFDLMVNATDNSSIDRVEYYIDGALEHTTTTAPYTYAWDIRTTSVPNADYQVTARAVDSSNNEATSTAKTVRVRHSDISRSGEVGIVDLSLLLGGWGDGDVRFDLDGNGSVGIVDLSRLLGQWGD